MKNLSQRAQRITKGFLILSCVLLASCAHVYHAPNNAKLEASTARLSNAVAKASNTAERARGHVEAAEAAAKKETSAAESLSKQTDELVALLPPGLKAKGEALKAAVAEDHAEVGEIVTNVYAAKLDHEQLKPKLAEAKAADAQVKIDKQRYYEDADKLAVTATTQSKALAWYRLHFFLGWAIFISGVIACIVLVIVKWGAKWGLKLGSAAAKVESGGIL